MTEYQKNYSKINPVVLDIESRVLKAKKIQCVIEDYYDNKPVAGIILDIGCSGGIILSHLNIPHDRKIGIDIDITALSIAHTNEGTREIDLLCADGMNLPFQDNSIGIIICNHVYEHLPNSEKLFKEIYRTLKPGGICYCAAGNKFSIMEGHYHLPFLSWMPKKLAHYYMRMMKRGDYYYENHLSWSQLKKRIQFFIIHDYSIKIIRNPDLFAGTDVINSKSIFSRIPEWGLKLLYSMIPTWIIILEKPEIM